MLFHILAENFNQFNIIKQPWILQNQTTNSNKTVFTFKNRIFSWFCGIVKPITKI